MSKDSEQTTQPTKKFDDSDPAEPKQSRTRGLIPWKPGQSGNSAGRQKGSRNKLSEDVIDMVAKTAREGGLQAFERMRDEHPADYCKMLVGLIPQYFRVEHEHTIAGLSPQELRDKLVEARARLLEAGVELGADDGALTLTAENAT
jgi:uncharacterized protein DUF5681